MTIEQIAARFNCSPDRVRAQFRANAEGLRQMLAKAERTGRRVNGYTADKLRALIAQADARAQE